MLPLFSFVFFIQEFISMTLLTHHLISAGFSYWLFGLLSISLLLLSSAFAKNVYQVLLFLAAFLWYWRIGQSL